MQRAPRTIRWSAKAWGLALCLISCLFFVAFQGGKLSLMLLIIISCLSVYLLMGRWSGISSARGRREIGGVAGGAMLQSGSAIKANIHVDIPGFWPIPYVTVKDKLTKLGGETHVFEGTFVPDWKRRGELTYVTPPLARGVYKYEAVECATQDIFGLFEHGGVISMPLSFSVLPRTVAIPEWRQLRTLFKGNHQQSSVNGSHRETTQINGVREYIYGDRLAKVHWRATARTGHWKSKEFERESLPKLTIVLDRQTTSYRSGEQFELAVSVAASIVQFAATRSMSVGFLSVGGGKAYAETPGGHETRRRIEQHLIEVQPDANGDPTRALRDRSRLPASGGLVVLVSPQRGEAVLKLLKWLDLGGLSACHLWINQETNAKHRDDWTAALRSVGVAAYGVQRLEELPLVLGGKGL
ncbi:DUF58 domain-containing protein [Paenibacillus sp.]|uniref:DUF58 domain-containing protein n=1 Tax=Paenibacillus sp. TaxID=58172 RepID=UPI002D244AA6|nr:DUF58 domain-containing protein [Paenibacillus sp.]HZG57147.1 DUF58 domain-containing protein [Paenibacillus sp.]